MKRLIGVDPSVRFDSHVDRMGDLVSAQTVEHYPCLEGTRCWVWMNVRRNRHPSFYHNGKYVKTSRFAFEMHAGRKILKGVHICHKCDNPICVNPSHLFEGTAKQNMEDRNAKGRQKGGATGPRVPLIGEKHRSAKLAERDVLYIRTNHSFEKRNARALAAHFGVSPQIIYRIVHGYTWNREGKSRVGDAEISQARREYANGYSTLQLAARYGMSCSSMYDAITGRTWKHVPGSIKVRRSPQESARMRRAMLKTSGMPIRKAADAK